jgi:hypothetical protein
MATPRPLVMSARRLALVTAAAVMGALASPAAAEPGAGLSYRAPGECPAEPAFVAAVTARGGRFERAAGGGAGRAFDVSITRSEDVFRGTLQVRASDGLSGAREVHAASCAEVVDGLAVVTAIALRAEPAAEPAPAPAPPPPPPGNPPGNKDRLRIMDVNWGDSIQVNGSKVDVGALVSVSFLAGAVYGMTPGTVLPRYDLSISRANIITPPDGQRYMFGAITRLHVGWFGPGTSHVAETWTRAYGYKVGADVCYSYHYDTRGLAFLLCSEVGGGTAFMNTKDGAGMIFQTKTSGFASIGLSPELQINLAKHFHFTLTAGSDVSLVKLSAELPDGTRIWSQGILSGYAVAGLGFQY